MTLKEKLRTHLNVINTYDLLVRFGKKRETDVAVSFHGRGPSRSLQPPQARVFSTSHNTNPKAAWYDRGCKTFVGNREESLPLAISWASQRYGIAEPDWVPCPTSRNTYVPRSVMAAAMAALKEVGVK